MKLTGKVIEVGMFTDAEGNYFTPKHIEAHRGDIVRFVLKSGVHNVNFVPDSNPGKSGLPKASDFLQLPGQEFDVVVSMAPGKYYFQCDPHALLGGLVSLILVLARGRAGALRVAEGQTTIEEVLSATPPLD